MSRDIVTAALGPFYSSYDMVRQFVEQCPEHIWAEKKGGWPVWQQVGHTFWALCFFAQWPGAAAVTPPCAEAVLDLGEQGTTVVDKATMKAFAAQCKAQAEGYFAWLADDKLTEVNKPVADAIGAPLTHAGTISLMAGHNFYHLGSCDAALREHGLPGVF